MRNDSLILYGEMHVLVNVRLATRRESIVSGCTSPFVGSWTLCQRFSRMRTHTCSFTAIFNAAKPVSNQVQCKLSTSDVGK
jgi:hypothetical protein